MENIDTNIAIGALFALALLIFLVRVYTNKKKKGGASRKSGGGSRRGTRLK